MRQLKFLAPGLVSLAIVTTGLAMVARTAVMQERSFVHYQEQAPHLIYPAEYDTGPARALSYRGDLARVLPTARPGGPMPAVEAAMGFVQSRTRPAPRYGAGTWAGDVLAFLDSLKPSAFSNAGAMGSGVYIEGGYFVTAWHVLDKSDLSTIQVVDATQGANEAGAWKGYPARLVAHDEVADLAILAVDRADPPAGLRLAKEAPAEGEAVYLAGFGTHPDLYRAVKAPAVGVIPQGPWERPASFLAIDGPAREGDSGGPVVNARGELVGILSATFGILHDAPIKGWPVTEATLATLAPKHLPALLAKCARRVPRV